MMDKWISVKDELPNHGAMCLISDGREIGMATADRELMRDGGVWWHGCGFGGYEWEWNFAPTHWMPFSISLPQKDAGK